ncbi:3-methyl-2-oxobutanoate hydroxymethyltransferase [bacterium]|nr:MAG: 3-methyl-2-oxobutanoate hydroxymethyltransferase [bacterium]
MASKGTGTSLDVFARRKRRGEKLVVVTAYDLTSARIAAAGGVDAILVGDSLGMVVLGHENTLPVTLQDMLHHAAAVVRARPEVPVIADLPYGSFHLDPHATVEAALRLVKEAGVQAVKIEGGRVRSAHIAALLAAEIPVMGHIGLTPQSVHRLGGYKVQGRGAKEAQHLRDEAAFLADAGCFSLVLECVPAPLATEISRAVTVPTVGIGAGAGCDGQVLVFHDLLGLFEGLSPRFVKRYAELGKEATAAMASYVAEVRGGVFPGPEHTYDAESRAAGSNESSATGYLGDVENGGNG